MKKLTFLFTGLCLMLGLAQAAGAEETGGPWIHSNDYRATAPVLALDKFGRGLVNASLGVLEIPKQSVKRAQDTDSVYGYASGLFLGIGYFVLRELAGVYEIATFPIPFPAGYAPVMDPLLKFDHKTLIN